MSDFRKKYGIVFLMDALGAKEYSDEKIQKFLRARSIIKESVAENVKSIKDLGNANLNVNPVTYMFGDTLAVVTELERGNESKCFGGICGMAVIIQSLIVLYMQAGILVRGAFSIGEYIDEEETNTVMGAAVSDAASWYEKSEWFGVAATPSANNLIEYLSLKSHSEEQPAILIRYPVPLKDGRNLELFCVPWPAMFLLMVKLSKELAEVNYLKIISNLSVPIGTEKKYSNSTEYFKHVINLNNLYDPADPSDMKKFLA